LAAASPSRDIHSPFDPRSEVARRPHLKAARQHFHFSAGHGFSHDKKAVAKRRTSKSREFSCSEGSRTPLNFGAREKTS
jgi:hypothetical protein